MLNLSQSLLPRSIFVKSITPLKKTKSTRYPEEMIFCRGGTAEKWQKICPENSSTVLRNFCWIDAVLLRLCCKCCDLCWISIGLSWISAGSLLDSSQIMHHLCSLSSDCCRLFAFVPSCCCLSVAVLLHSAFFISLLFCG